MMGGQNVTFMWDITLMTVFSFLVVPALVLFLLYLIVRAAINNSKLNKNIELLGIEISRLNNHLQTTQTSSDGTGNQEGKTF